MSEQNQNDNTTDNTPTDGGDIERLKNKNGELIGANKDLKSQLNSMKDTMELLAKHQGFESVDNIAGQMKAKIEADEQEKLSKMSDHDKLVHSIEGIQKELSETKIKKEQAEKINLNLTIDSSIKNALQKQGVTDPNKLAGALSFYKEGKSIQGLENDSLKLGDGSDLSIDDSVKNFLGANTFFMSANTQSGANVATGNPVLNTGAIENDALWKQAKDGNINGLVDALRNPK